MGKPWSEPSFKALLKEWNAKLAASGFKDIETDLNGKTILYKSGTERRYQSATEIVRQSKVEYFRILAQKMNETVIEDPIEFEILTLHADGVRQCEIKLKLSKNLSRSTIYKKLYKWLKIWKLK